MHAYVCHSCHSWNAVYHDVVWRKIRNKGPKRQSTRTQTTNLTHSCSRTNCVTHTHPMIYFQNEFCKGDHDESNDVKKSAENQF